MLFALVLAVVGGVCFAEPIKKAIKKAHEEISKHLD